MNRILIEQADYQNNDFIILCEELDKFLNDAIGGKEKREKYIGFNNLDTMDYIIIAYDHGYAVGCAALRKFSKQDIEIKRVFIREEYRGKNIGGIMLENLIVQSKKRGYQHIILETGDFLEASVRLYSRYGFERIENYGGYKDKPESLCMGLNIGEDDISYCTGRWVGAKELRELFESIGWLSANYADRLSKAFQKAGTVISAWHSDKLIGLIEVLDDGELNAYIHYLLVHPAYQNRGIGSALLKKVQQKYKDYLYLVAICENESTVPFYKRNCFETATGATPLQIRNL